MDNWSRVKEIAEHYGAELEGTLADSGRMHCSTGYGLVKAYVAIPDFDVKTAIRIGAYPRLIVYRCSMATVVRKGYELAHITLEALRYSLVFHKNLLPRQVVAEYNIVCQELTRFIMLRFSGIISMSAVD